MSSFVLKPMLLVGGVVAAFAVASAAAQTASIPDFSSNGTKWAPADFPTVAHALYGNGAEIVPGWRLRLHLSKGDKAYDLLLEDVTDPKCGYAVFSDERGLIRQGKSIDCAL